MAGHRVTSRNWRRVQSSSQDSTRILLLRIFPRGGDAEAGVGDGVFHASEKCLQICRRAGELTKQLADGKQVFWLDINNIFLRPDGTINTDLMPDLLHPNAASAEAWARAIETTLERLMRDDPVTVATPGRRIRWNGRDVARISRCWSIPSSPWGRLRMAARERICWGQTRRRPW